MSITVERLSAEVDADPAGAIAALGAFDAAAAAAAKDRTAHINLDFDRNAIGKAVQDIQGFGAFLGDGFKQATTGAETFTKAGSEAAETMAGIGGGATKAGSGLTSFGGGMGNIILQAVMMIPQLIMMGTLLATIATAATAAVGAIQMLAAAAVGLVAAVTPLVGLLGAIPVGLAAIGGGIGVVVTGFMGIGDAVKAMDSAEKAATKSTYSATAAARDLRSARMGLRDATRQVAQAEKDLAEAQADVAVQREAAAKDLVQRRRDLRDAVWAEEDAVDRLRKAQDNLRKAQMGTSKSTTVLTKETDDFSGKVYEVARVSGDMVDAAEAQKDAQREVIRAQEELERSHERVKDARDALNDAEKKGIDQADRVVQANRRVENAQEALARAHDNVAAAQERVGRVMEENAARAAGGTAAANALAQAMAGLTTEGQHFARFVHNELQPAWKTITDSAQKGLLPGVEDGLKNIMKVFPTLRAEAGKTGKAIGDAFRDWTAGVNDPQTIGNLKTISADLREILVGNNKKGKEETLGLLDALKPMGDIFVSILKAATPMTKMLTNDLVNGLNGIAKWMANPKNAKKMESFFTNGYKQLKKWGDVLRPLAGIFSSVTTAAQPLADWMLGGMADKLDKIDENLKKPGGLNGLKKWFDDMKPAIKETVGLAGDLFDAIFKTPAGGDNSAFVDLIKSLRDDVMPNVKKLLEDLTSQKGAGTAFADLVNAIIDAIDYLVKNPDDVKNFVQSMADIVKGVSNLIGFFRDSETPVNTATDKNHGTLYKVAAAITFLGWSVMHHAAMVKGFAEIGTNFVLFANKMRDGARILVDMFTFNIQHWFEGVARDFAIGVNKIITKYNDFAKKIGKVPGLPALPQVPTLPVPGGDSKGRTMVGGEHNAGLRQFGGPAKKGEPIVVGEKRPELFIPNQGGRIAAAVPRSLPMSNAEGISEEQLEKVLNRVLEKAKPHVDVKVDQSERSDPREIGREIAWAIR